MVHKKILFLINNLDMGGAEKILVEIVHNLNSLKYDVTVMTIVDKGVYKDEIPKSIRYLSIFKNRFHGRMNSLYYSLILRILKVLPSKLQYLMFIKDKYDVEIAFLEGAPTKIISSSSTKLKYAWVHVDPVEQPNSQRAYLTNFLEKKAYLKFDDVFCVSSDVKKNFMLKFGIDKKVHFQMNILDEENVISRGKEIVDTIYSTDCFNFISIGRLAFQKNYFLLLDVVNKLINIDKYSFRVYIFGEGPERQNLENKILEYGLSNHFILKGFVANPYPYLVDADLFICSSRAEGFSTSVTESLILQTPVLTTDCSGMKDLLGDSEYGIICSNNFDGLYSALKKIVSNKNLLADLKNKAINRSSYFKKELRVKEFEKLLDR